MRRSLVTSISLAACCIVSQSACVSTAPRYSENGSQYGDVVITAQRIDAEHAPNAWELLRQLVPKATKIAALVNPGTPTTEAERKDVQAAARILVGGGDTGPHLLLGFQHMGGSIGLRHGEVSDVIAARPLLNGLGQVLHVPMLPTGRRDRELTV